MAEAFIATSARVAGDDARSRVVVEFDRAPEFRVHYVQNPARIVVDLPITEFRFAADAFAAKGLFSDVRYGIMDAESARIVLTARGPVALADARVTANEDGNGVRLVLDAEQVTAERFAALVAEQVWAGGETTAAAVVASPPAEPGQFVIAIDAGHGGIDTGATGTTSGTQEKQVTLEFARELKTALADIPGLRVVLTRDADRFLSLPQRVNIARQQGANLLISLHADTLRQKDIRGATVYTISDKASDHLAQSLAERENLSDEIAGIALESEPTEVADILIDFTRRETQVFSISLARAVVAAFEGQVNLINNPHRHAGFRVLQAPDVPSVLVELGFLSNAEDEKLLLDPAWRKKVATLLAAAVERYVAEIPAKGG